MAEEKKAKAGEETERGDVKEAAMFELMKELFAFGYGAADRMEERAMEFAAMRRERMAEFRKDVEGMDQKFKGTFDERTGEVRGRVRKEVMNVMRETGVATQQEVEELKSMISDLSAKLDKMGGAKTEKPK